MKYSIILVNAFFAIALAQKNQQQTNQPAENNKYRNIPIVAQENILDHDGQFSYNYEGV